MGSNEDRRKVVSILILSGTYLLYDTILDI